LIAPSVPLREKPDLRQHRGMGERAANVLPPQLAVEPDGGIDVLHDDRGPAGEAAAPLGVGRLVRSVPGRAVRRVGHGDGSSSMMYRRRILGAAAGTLAAGAVPRKLLAESLPPLAEGLSPVSPPGEPPDGVFIAADGSTHRLAEFRGRGMVVNLWATWCAPCVAEMPSLEALSKALAPQDIAVLPLSSDRGGADAVLAWYQQHGITGLPVLLDPKGALARAFSARGIPTTVVIDTSGHVVARLEGAADWSAPAAEALVRKLAAG